jgi:uncharacterized cupredoxin-like copper-binding protein
MKPRLAVLVAVPVVAAGALIAGCGSNSSIAASPPAKTTTTMAATTSGTVAAKDGKVTVTTTDFAFMPTAITAAPGKLKLTLSNQGKVEHEMVVLKTDQAADALKVGSGARVSEYASVGEVSETAPGATKSATLDLKAGKYVYVCNIPGHYGDGMYGTLTVK